MCFWQKAHFSFLRTTNSISISQRLIDGDIDVLLLLRYKPQCHLDILRQTCQDTCGKLDSSRYKKLLEHS